MNAPAFKANQYVSSNEVYNKFKKFAQFGGNHNCI